MARSRTSMHAFGVAALVAAMAISGCGDDRADATRDAGASVDPSVPSQVVEWTLPSTLPGSASPSLADGPGDRLLLSWINSQQGRRHILQFSSWSTELQRWMHGMSTIAIGHSMFVNWADVPHMAATADGALWAHWLQKNGDAPYAYDVVVSRSRDGGANWAAPVVPHEDRTQTEHGFVSMWAQGPQQLGIAWLDGRNTGGGGHDGHVGHGGAMTLRAAVFDGELQRTQDAEIDASVCDCCQTAVAMTSKGALLVYRGRAEGEIRDTLAARFDGTAWSTPRAVHADGWVMPACPVNGPDVAADGDRVVVAWYTEGGGQPEVRIAASQDAGDGFSAPVSLDAGEAVHGRVAVALGAGQAWILWLREEGGQQSLWLSRRGLDLATEHERIEVSKVNGAGRATGFPQIAVRGGSAYVVWTDVANGVPNLKGVRVERE